MEFISSTVPRDEGKDHDPRGNGQTKHGKPHGKRERGIEPVNLLGDPPDQHGHDRGSKHAPEE